MNLRAYLKILNKPASKLLRRLAYASAAALMVSAVIVFMVVDSHPWIWQKEASTQHYFAETRNILRNTVKNPDQAKDPVRTVSLSDEDLTAVANFVLMRKEMEGFARAEIYEKRLVIKASIRLPFRFADFYLNLRLIADDGEPNAFVKQVKAGFIALPKPVVKVLGWWLMRTTHIGHYVSLIRPLIREVRIGEGRLRISLNWNREIMGQAQDLVADLADKELLRVYQAKLAELVAQSQTRRFIGLWTLMRPLFSLARERTQAEGGDAKGENRALLLVLATYANGKNLGPAIFPEGGGPELAKREVLLSRRVDSAQHFTASAVLTISGQKAFTDMVGLAKEFNDTHGGTGFSFIDLAADRAGALFGKMAIESEESARRVQEIISQAADESVFMPQVLDLPENLKAEDFATQFGDTESPKFQQLKQLIEERITACRLYQ